LSKRKNPAEQELADYKDLMTWISEEADEVLQIVDQPNKGDCLIEVAV
jgi:hypothetical protein